MQNYAVIVADLSRAKKSKAIIYPEGALLFSGIGCVKPMSVPSPTMIGRTNMPELDKLKVGSTYTIIYVQTTTTTDKNPITKEEIKIKHKSVGRVVGKYLGRGPFGAYIFGVGPFRNIPRWFWRKSIKSVEGL
jgi:hypothetical protein